MEDRSDTLRRLRSRLAGPEASAAGDASPASSPAPESAVPPSASKDPAVASITETPDAAPSVASAASSGGSSVPGDVDEALAKKRLRDRLGGVPTPATPVPVVVESEEIKRLRERLEFEGYIEPHEAGPPARSVPERRIFQVLATAAAMTIALSVALSWVTPAGFSLIGHRQVVRKASTGSTESAAPPLPKGPALMLPDQIISYETIDRHVVPGSNGMSAESIYQTYNMHLQALAETVVYARVDGYASEVEARAALDRLMARYPADAQEMPLKYGYIGHYGLTKDQKTMVVAWQSGRYVTWTKTMFVRSGTADPKRGIPLLTQIAEPIYRTVALYQSRGLQGVKANTLLFGGKSEDPSSTLPAVDANGQVVP